MCVLISVYLFNAISIVKGKNNKYFLIIILLLLILVFPRDFGIESHLACLVTAVFLYLKSLEYKDEISRPVASAVILALLFLTRTDYLLTIIPFIIIADVYTTSKDNRFIKIIFEVGFVILAAILYYSSNVFLFGSMTTTPSKILNSFPTIVLGENIKVFSTAPEKIFNQTGRFLFLILTLTVSSVMLFKNKYVRTEKVKFILVVYGISFGSAVFALSHIFFNYTGVREWYLTMPLLACSILATDILKKKYYNIAIALLFAALVFVTYKTRFESDKFTSPYNYAKLLNEKTTKEDRIFQIDFSGIVGFISERHIINGDGLANSFEYLNYKREGRLKEYFINYRVNYYSTYSYNVLNEKDTVFMDTTFRNFSKGYDFTFLVKDLVLRLPFYYKHTVLNLKGEWYLFRIND
jgi:hypothetical protein